MRSSRFKVRVRPSGTWQDLRVGKRPKSNCSKYNAKGGMRFAFPPYGLAHKNVEKDTHGKEEL